MKIFVNFFIITLIFNSIFGAQLIDSWLRANSPTFASIFRGNIFPWDDKCNLSLDLINEIRSYEPIVDQIVSSIVNGKYSNDTWNRLVNSFI